MFDEYNAMTNYMTYDSSSLNQYNYKNMDDVLPVYQQDWPGPVMNTVMLGGGGAGRGSSSPRSPEVPVNKGTTTQR